MVTKSAATTTQSPSAARFRVSTYEPGLVIVVHLLSGAPSAGPAPSAVTLAMTPIRTGAARSLVFFIVGPS
jgi:hypothetical protein